MFADGIESDAYLPFYTSRRCGNRRATRFATLEPRGIRRGGRKPCQEQHDVIYFHLVLLLLLPRRVFFLSPLKSNPRACLILLYNYSTRVWISYEFIYNTLSAPMQRFFKREKVCRLTHPGVGRGIFPRLPPAVGWKKRVKERDNKTWLAH